MTHSRMASTVLMIVSLALGFAGEHAFAAAAEPVPVCRGVVASPAGGEATITLPLPGFPNGLNVGDKFSMWHPIFDEVDAAVQLTVREAAVVDDGYRVFATYDGGGSAGFISFVSKYGPNREILLASFKGFEGDFAFGPVDLLCK